MDYHKELGQLIGAKKAKDYLVEVVKDQKVKNLGEISDNQIQAEILLHYREEIAVIKGGPTGEATASSSSAPPPEEGPPEPFGRWVGKSYEGLMKVRYAGLQKLDEDGLLEVINTADYPKEDPEKIGDILNKGIGRENLLEASIKIVEYGLKNLKRRSS